MPRGERNEPMKKARSRKETKVEIRAEYDFSGGVRGKYARAMAKGSNLILLDPELAKAFPDSASVNEALHQLLAVARRAKTSHRHP
jgi:hypothetical protein